MSRVLFPSWSETIHSMDDLVKQEGVHYQKFNDVPFTGDFVNYWSKRTVSEDCGQVFMLKKMEEHILTIKE